MVRDLPLHPSQSLWGNDDVNDVKRIIQAQTCVVMGLSFSLGFPCPWQFTSSYARVRPSGTLPYGTLQAEIFQAETPFPQLPEQSDLNFPLADFPVQGFMGAATINLLPLDASGNGRGKGAKPRSQLNSWSGLLAQTPPEACPDFFRPLVQFLLQDLASYANREFLRLESNQASHTDVTHTYVTMVGKPDFRALALEPLITTFPELDLAGLMEMEGVRQVFITSLERRHTPQGTTEQQQFHWLFFQRSDQHPDHRPDQDWQLLKALSHSGPYPGYPGESSGELGPLRDSGGEPLATAIRRQLRDCQTGPMR
jgi:hypothetical protein